MDDDDSGPNVVTAFNLTGKVSAPVKGAKPVATAIDETQYTGAVLWQTADGAAISGNFAAETVYKAVVFLTANYGYTFAGVAANAFSYTGATVTNAANSGTVTISFPATDANKDTIVSALDLTGKLTAPVRDAAPVTTAIDETQYSGIIVWKAADDSEISGNFVAGTVYKAVVSLTANYGYTFIGVTANAFTYTGATVTNVANSGAVTISFPATAVDPLPALGNALGELSDTTAENPSRVVLEAFAISANNDSASDWGRVNTAVKNAQKHVILDLSDCTFTDNEVAGSYDGDIGMNIIKDNEYIKGIILPENVTSIGEYAFYDCRSLTSVTIPEGVTSIGEWAFRYCEGLTSITIPEGVTSIGVGAFSGCAGLTSITIPEGVTSIGGVTFSGCAGLTSVTIPEGVASIGGGAFSGCTGLTSVTIPEGVTSIGREAFRYCEGLTSVTIPEGVTSIEEYTFAGCEGLTSVTIPASVTSIGEWAFRVCWRLTSVTIPEGVTSIEESAFYGCRSLTSVTIPEGVTSIGEWAFYDCWSLTSVTIQEGVTSIEERTFDGCRNLPSVTIPASVTSIGEWAFSGCSVLTSVTFERDGIDFGYASFPYPLIGAYETYGFGTYTLNSGAWTKTP
jgi:hypothetical protein